MDPPVCVPAVFSTTSRHRLSSQLGPRLPLGGAGMPIRSCCVPALPRGNYHAKFTYLACPTKVTWWHSRMGQSYFMSQHGHMAHCARLFAHLPRPAPLCCATGTAIYTCHVPAPTTSQNRHECAHAVSQFGHVLAQAHCWHTCHRPERSHGGSGTLFGSPATAQCHVVGQDCTVAQQR